MDPVRATTLLLCLTLSAASLGTSNSAPLSSQSPSATPSPSPVEVLGSGEPASLHQEITNALTESNEAVLLSRVRRIVTKRSGSTGCPQTCRNKTYEELATLLSNRASDFSNSDATASSVWSVNMNFQSGVSTKVSFGASTDVLTILNNESHSECVELSVDEDSERFPKYILTASLKGSCPEGKRQRYSCVGNVMFLTLRLDKSRCDSNGKEVWSDTQSTYRNCRLR